MSWDSLTLEERQRAVEIADWRYAYLMAGGTLTEADQAWRAEMNKRSGRRLLDAHQAARALGLSTVRSISRLRLENGLPSEYTNGKHHYCTQALSQWAKANNRRLDLSEFEVDR